MKQEEMKEISKSGMHRYGMMKKTDKVVKKMEGSKMKALKSCCK